MRKWGPVARAAVLTFGGGLAVLTVGLIVVGFLAGRGSIGTMAGVTTVTAVYAVLLMIGSVWIAAVWMRGIDEAAREAHKAAWYWGGTAGMAVGGVGVILAASPGAANWRLPSLLPGRADPAAYAVTGVAIVIGLMLAGYVVYWIWWWLARTRG